MTMKHSGIAWIGDIPAEWKVGRIKYCYDIVLGKMLQPNQEKNTDREMYYMCSANVTWDGIDLSVLKQMWFSPSEVKMYLLQKGDLLVAEGGDIAIACIWNNELHECCLQNALHLIRNNEKHLNKFLYYWLYFLKHTGYIDLICNKATIAHFTKEKFGESPICVLPIAEQRAIAAFLDRQCGKVDSIITELEQQIEILKQYKMSLITETITKGLNKNVPMKNSGINWIGKIPAHWEVKKLKYIGNAKNGLTYSPENISNEGILVLRSSNIQEGKLTFEDNIYVDMKIPKDIVVRENDILICSRNGSRELIGKCVLIDKKTEGNTYGAFMCVFRSHYNQFIHYIFQSNLFNYYLGNYLTSTINQLTNSNLHNMKIPITFDEREQSQIVTYLDNHIGKIDNLISAKQQSIDTMKAYKKSLIYE
jgi:type I restriction enzyme S subunit